MKKTLLLGAMLAGSYFTASAQQIFSVDFSSTQVLVDNNWLLIDGDGDELTWQVDTAGSTTTVGNGFTGGVALSASFDNDSGPLTPDNSLVTQSFAVPANGATLTFKIGGMDPEFSAEHYAVYVINAADITETTTVGEFLALLTTPKLEETLGGATAVNKTVSLAGHEGQTVRIVFRHYNITDQFVIVLDDVTVTAGNVTGVNDALASQLSVYPNPVNNVINISNAENILVNGVEIVDLNGRTIKSSQFDGVANTEINVSDLASGVYMMTISSDKGTTTKKIVKN